MKLLEGGTRWGLWLTVFGLGTTTLISLGMSIYHSFITSDQSVSRGELDFGCTIGLAAFALLGLLLTTRKR